ncbi:MAG: hypothetical protein IKJ00_08935 [Clostridia bacterium]|nr:hypothetical protein [Clostridia bacterium]
MSAEVVSSALVSVAGASVSSSLSSLSEGAGACVWLLLPAPPSSLLLSPLPSGVTMGSSYFLASVLRTLTK